MSTEQFNEIKNILKQHENRISQLENLLKTKPRNIEKELSIKEFILQKLPVDDIQKTLVIGYYLEHFRNISPLNAKDLEQAFKETKEKVPENIRDKVNKNIEKGFMMDAKEKKDGLKSWTLTTTGERFVESKLKTN